MKQSMSHGENQATRVRRKKKVREGMEVSIQKSRLAEQLR